MAIRFEQVQELANAIAQQAEAIATGSTSADSHTVALLIQGNVETLVAWTKLLRETPCEATENGVRCVYRQGHSSEFPHRFEKETTS